MAFGESAGLLFKIKGDASDAIRAFNQTERASAGLTGSASKLTSSFSALLGPATLAAAGVAAVGVAAVAGVTALFNLSKQAAEYGSAIFDATQKTGLGAETMSALKVAAEQSGSSFESITNAVSKFNVLLGQASAGSEKAQKTLAQYGITQKDTNGAFTQAVAAIARMKDSTEQAAAAQALFKDRTAAILPVIKSFDGDLPALINKLRDLGVLMSDEDAKAADEFGDQMDMLNQQLSAVARNIGIEFMPVFRNMATALSDFVKNNKDGIREWGSNFSLTIQGLIIKFGELKKAADDYYISDAVQWILRHDPLMRDAAAAGEAVRAAARAGQTKLSYADMKRAGDTNTLPNIPTTSVGEDEKIKRSNIGRADSQAKFDAASRAFELRNLAAEISIEASNLRTVQRSLEDAYAAMRKTLSEGGVIEGFAKATNETTQQWAENLNNSLKLLEELERKALRKDATASERAALEQQQNDRRHALKLAQDKEIQRNQDALLEAKEAMWAAEAKAAADKAIRAQEEWEKEQERLEAMGGGLTKDYGADLFDRLTADQEGGPFDAWTESWNTFADAIAERVGDIESSLGTMAGVLQHAFQGIANAIGSVVQQWVLYGTTGPAVMRKVLASALATIAAEAAVQAIYATALGFLKLAMGDFSGAAFAFGSAVLWASIAGVAAVAGRAVAGNAFQQQTSQATGTSASRAESNTSAQGRAYSSQKDYTHEEGRNAPLGVAVQISFKDKPEWFDRMFETRWRANGAIRRLVEDGR